MDKLWENIHPLHDAVVRRNHDRLLRLCKDANIDINEVIIGADGRIGKVCPGILYPSSLVRAMYYAGDTALHLAVYCDDIKSCQILLAHGANPIMKGGHGLPIMESE